MKQRIEKLIPKAIDLIADTGIAKEGEVNNTFNGYFSSFGAAIVRNGITPTLAFYANEASQTEQDRSKIPVAIYRLITDKEANVSKANSLLFHYIKSSNKELLKHEIIDAAIALKLAIRTYKLKKNRL